MTCERTGDDSQNQNWTVQTENWTVTLLGHPRNQKGYLKCGCISDQTITLIEVNSNWFILEQRTKSKLC